MRRGLLLFSSLAFFAFATACEGFVELSGKTPITGTIRVPPSASCPVPAPAQTATTTPTASARGASSTPDSKGGKK
ncbi:MAG: hypothetical protein U0174_09415 [Polyangiaceae bacterium]